MEGRKVGGRERGRVQSVHCRPGCAEQDGEAERRSLLPTRSGRDVSQDEIYNGRCVFRTETSRNLTKRFRGNNNSDLKHQRVI